ncbi:MAG: LPP20 family lipoprotein [Treponema sp.]|nr:LPP20 family lipoprotein [Treponema sp.]
MSKMTFSLTTMFAVTIFLFSACAGSPSAGNSAAEAEAAAQAALAVMDGAGNAPLGGIAQVAAQAGHRPVWMDNAEAAYPRSRFVTAVGHGSNRELAERDALARIVGVFGQAVQAELRTVATFSEAVRDGVIRVTEDTAIQNAITTSAQMETLVGAEIADVWFDAASNTHFAIAVMENERTSILYADLIRSNEQIIRGLVDMTFAERYSFEGFARYRLAAAIADTNRVYANVLTVVGDTRGINPAEVRSGEEFRVAAAQVRANIPIGVVVSGDRAGRLHSAFSAAVNAAGFRSGGEDSRYLLRFSYDVVPANLPGSPHQFVRFELVGALEDTAMGNSVMFSFFANGREGHLTQSEAEERAIRQAERRIAEAFTPSFHAYLDNLVALGR